MYRPADERNFFLLIRSKSDEDGKKYYNQIKIRCWFSRDDKSMTSDVQIKMVIANAHFRVKKKAITVNKNALLNNSKNTINKANTENVKCQKYHYFDFFLI